MLNRQCTARIQTTLTPRHVHDGVLMPFQQSSPPLAIMDLSWNQCIPAQPALCTATITSLHQTCTDHAGMQCMYKLSPDRGEFLIEGTAQGMPSYHAKAWHLMHRNARWCSDHRTPGLMSLIIELNRPLTPVCCRPRMWSWLSRCLCPRKGLCMTSSGPLQATTLW